MKKIIILLLFLLVTTFHTASAETLSLTTYYPAPFGVYNELRLVPLGADPACTAGNDGLLWINASNELRMCNGTVGGPVDAIWTQNDPPTRVWITDMGAFPAIEVGIGTSAPQEKLHIQTPAGTASLIQYTVTGVANEWTAGTSTAGNYNVNHVGGGTPFFIDTAETVQVGIADATADLQINGNANSDAILFDASQSALRHHTDMLTTQRGSMNFLIDTDANNGAASFNIFNNLAASAGNADFHFDVDGGDSWLNGGGNLAINHTAPGDTIDVNGTGRIRGDLLVSDGASGNVTAHAFFYVSDEDMKENIKPVSGLEAITQLEGVQFKWKDSGKTGVGLVAQDVEKVFPDLVEINSTTNTKSVSYGNLVAPLIEAIKEQQKQIEVLQKEIEELKTRQF